MSKAQTIRTTVRLEEGLLSQAKAEAGRRHKTLTSFIEEGLRLALAAAREPDQRKKVVLPVSRRKGGVLPGVDLSNSADLLDILGGLR